MLIRNDIPILEFDEAKDAAINPCDIAKYTGQIGCERLVITFFGEVIEEASFGRENRKNQNRNGRKSLCHL